MSPEDNMGPDEDVQELLEAPELTDEPDNEPQEGVEEPDVEVHDPEAK